MDLVDIPIREIKGAEFCGGKLRLYKPLLPPWAYVWRYIPPNFSIFYSGGILPAEGEIKACLGTDAKGEYVELKTGWNFTLIRFQRKFYMSHKDFLKAYKQLKAEK